jgi:uncharacterized protein (TIGR03437 family)
MNIYARLLPLLLAGVLSADPPVYVMSTAAGYIPGATPIALQQHLIQPVVVAYDPNGNLYYGTRYQIWRFNPDWTDTLIAGSSATGSNPSGDGGLAASAALGWVAGLAVDAQQNVYIADLAAYQVRKVTAAGMIMPFAGTGAAPLDGEQSNASPATAALKVPLIPGPLAIDSINLYVSDSGTSSVVAFTLDGKGSKVIAGNHGNQSMGDGGPATAASLFYPGTLSLAAGILSINEAGGARIRQVNLRTGTISTLLQLASGYLTDNGNEGLASDSDGTVYVQRGNTATRLDPNTTTPQPWAGGGNANPGDPGPALAASLVNPESLAVNPVTHDIALADNAANIIQVVSRAAGAIQTYAGTVHFSGDFGPAALAIFDGMEGVVSDSQGNLYVADTGNNRIRKIDTTGIVTTIAGNGVNGFSGDGGPATFAALDLKHQAPFANNLAIDSSGNLYVSDYGNGRIRKIDPTGVITTVAGGGHVALTLGDLATAVSMAPGPLAVDSKGNIYFGNVFTLLTPMMPNVYKIDAVTGQIVPYAGGSGKAAPTGPATSTPIGYAYCLVTDSLDNLYVCDSQNNLVRQVTPKGVSAVIAGNGTASPGPIPPGNPTATAIGSPTAVAVDTKGDVFIYSQRQVSEIDGAGMLQPVAGANSQPMVSGGDGGWATQASFTSVSAMALDANGNLYLTDAGVYLREAMPMGANGPPPVISSGGVVGAGDSYPPVQSISPGGIVSIFGANFSPTGDPHPLTGADMLHGQIPTALAGTCVSFGGVNAPITGVFPNQINLQVPVLPPGAVTVQVTTHCGGSNAVVGNFGAVRVDAASPEFFSSSDPASSLMQIAAANVAGGDISAGSIVEAYGTGWGVTNPPIAPGAIPIVAAPLANPPTLFLGGTAVPSANILYAGISPCCAGVYQVDFKIPSGAPPGPQTLVITINGISSPPNAYINVIGQ